ncbi:hypothetical protein G647_10123 [Cladophialophora carrionii CBS 160.54]|uniref:Zn(2)-C6 fungal-type domain-containing protein n=1 Tax=Cladophialophora carrionii CBS 160.54 TaxID=1279043 RepID=V9DJF7_9EURO|nr:uncharacterized protein G647_10123 [Cladophialophora carrionii CBS 160.54]ETI27024.1 hypothetical protein G647_10123 [Cladophialophora carrionii CBS 160.54]
MPGVPSGRGCDACRQQKKKCDLSEHPCPRCRRLNIRCVGFGQRRYKFVHDDKSPSASDSSSNHNGTNTNTSATAKLHGKKTVGIERYASLIRSLEGITIHASPWNATTRLAGAFTDMIKPTVSIKYNLAWTYGDYLNHVPSRLGVNEALDNATDAFVTAVGTLSEHSNGAGAGGTVLALEKYGRTLASLRRCLDDPVKAQAPETLCAILFLWNCQQYIWMPEGSGRHAEGVAQIIRLRGCAETSQDPFESNLLLSLRAVVLFDSLFNGRVHFTDDEWIAMFDNKLHGLTPEGQSIRMLTRVPNLMRRARAVLTLTLTPPVTLVGGTPQQQQQQYQDIHSTLLALQAEANTLRNDFEAPLSTLRKRWYDNMHPRPTADVDGTLPNRRTALLQTILHCHFLRTYSLGLAVAIIINEVRLAVCAGVATGPPSSAVITAIIHESHGFALEILDMAAQAVQYRPLGVNALGVCLLAAEIGAGDAHMETKLRARALRVDFARDFRGAREEEAQLWSQERECERLICGRDWAEGLG